eukprot:scaffold634281_cov24-Prasinocladus_malaysianus.AAC.1
MRWAAGQRIYVARMSGTGRNQCGWGGCARDLATATRRRRSRRKTTHTAAKGGWCCRCGHSDEIDGSDHQQGSAKVTTQTERFVPGGLGTLFGGAVGHRRR